MVGFVRLTVHGSQLLLRSRAPRRPAQLVHRPRVSEVDCGRRTGQDLDWRILKAMELH